MAKKKNISNTLIFFSVLDSVKIKRPVPEFVFHPTRKFRFDYCWVENKIALEIEGGIWMNGKGAHSRPMNIERDMEKQNLAAVLGYRILRIQPTNLCKTETIQLLKSIIN